MKARIIKKLSKKIKSILPKEYERVWVNDEVMEESWSQGSKVSHCHMIGGECDEWGEGTDYYSVLHDFKYNFLEWQGLWGFYDETSRWEDMPKPAPYRLTGKKLIELTKRVK